MQLTRHDDKGRARWAADGRYLTRGCGLAALLELGASQIEAVVQASITDDPADGPLLAPVEPAQEVWASGVTYLRSREARVVESDTADIYEKVYDAPRAELFFKSTGWRAVGQHGQIRIRADSAWNVPEPELTLVINSDGEIVGFTAGNDMSSRDIEGENPLYLPQAKIYDGGCALGPAVVLADAGKLGTLPIRMTIRRDGKPVFDGETSTAQMKRSPAELADWLFREIAFPDGVLLMTGAGIVPPDAFTLAAGDVVTVAVGPLELTNSVSI